MTDNVQSHSIVIIDFGSQFAQLIARRVRELGVYCQVVAADVDDKTIIDLAPQGIILSGGPETVTVDHSPRVTPAVFNIGCPVLGICYGMQVMALQLGGDVELSQRPEFGFAEVVITDSHHLLTHIDDRINDEGQALLDVWMNHSDHVTALPPEFVPICHTTSAPYAGMADFKRHFYGVQFHPEVTHTRQGNRILSHFVFDICQAQKNWTSSQIIEDALVALRQQVGDDHVLVGLSGGVDSAVVAALLHQAVGSQLTCLLVDTGLLRVNEAQQVIAIFAEHMGVNVVCVDAKTQFYQALVNVSDPEKKRKIIGKLFIDVFEQHAATMPAIKWLGQGTIYPDVIESAKTQTGTNKVIKSHHNVGGLPEDMRLGLVEPLRELFKDEVRHLGLELGLPYEMVYRHPFPGPGLAVRIMGEVTQERVAILQQADAIFMEVLHKHDWYQKVSQAFAVYLPVKSVGVKGDARHYGDVIALRAVCTTDFMTAEWAELPHHLLAEASQRIVNEVNPISRVVYDISGKPPATIEWE